MKKSELRQLIKEELLNEGSKMKLNLGDTNNTMLIKLPEHSHAKLIQIDQLAGKKNQVIIQDGDVDYFIAALKRLK